jgi:hypothetical protein
MASLCVSVAVEHDITILVLMDLPQYAISVRGWQRQAESSELADGSDHLCGKAIGKLRLPLPPGD